MIEEIKKNLRTINISHELIDTLDKVEFSDAQLYFINSISSQIKSKHSFRTSILNFIKERPVASFLLYILIQAIPISLNYLGIYTTQIYMDEDDMKKIGDGIQQVFIFLNMVTPMVPVAIFFDPFYRFIDGVVMILLDILTAIKNFIVVASEYRITHKSTINTI